MSLIANCASPIWLADIGLEIVDGMDLTPILEELSVSADLFVALADTSIVVSEGVVDLTLTAAINAIKKTVSYSRQSTIDTSRQLVHSTKQPTGTVTAITGRGDELLTVDGTLQISYGTGAPFIYSREVGAADTDSFYIDLYMQENDTFLSHGAITWENAYQNCMDFYIVAKKSTGTATTEATGYYETAEHVVIPSALAGGYSNIDMTDIVLVEATKSRVVTDGIYSYPQSFWTADWDTATKTYVNLQPKSNPADLKTGGFNIFTNERQLDKFVSGHHLNGDNHIPLMLENDSIGQLPANCRLKINLNRNPAVTDQAMTMFVMLYLYRQKNI